MSQYDRCFGLCFSGDQHYVFEVPNTHGSRLRGFEKMCSEGDWSLSL